MSEQNDVPSIIEIPVKKSSKAKWVEYALIREKQVAKQIANYDRELEIARSEASEFREKFRVASNRCGELAAEVASLRDQIADLELDDAEELARLERDEARDRMVPELGAPAPSAATILVSQERTCPWSQHEDQPRTWVIGGRIYCPKCGLPKG